MNTASVVRVRQGSPEWHDFRRSHIGSSDAPIIAGESPYQSPLDLYVRKLGQEDEPDAATAHRFMLGHVMEPIALDMVKDGNVAGIVADEVEERTITGEDQGDSQDLLRLKWIECIRTRAPTPSPVELATKVMVIVDLATRSLWEGGAFSYDPVKRKVKKV